MKEVMAATGGFIRSQARLRAEAGELLNADALIYLIAEQCAHAVHTPKHRKRLEMPPPRQAEARGAEGGGRDSGIPARSGPTPYQEQSDHTMALP